MTQVQKGTAERTGLIRGADQERGPRANQRETENKAEMSVREAREKAEIERIPGGKSPSAGAGSTPDVDSLMQNPPEAAGEEEKAATAVMGEQGEIEPDDKKPHMKKPPPQPGNEGADKTTGGHRRPDGGPLDPAGSFVPGAVLPSSVPNASPNLKKKLNDLPADDPERAKIPPELKI